MNGAHPTAPVKAPGISRIGSRSVRSTAKLLALASLCCACATESVKPPPPSVGATQVLGPFTGLDARLHPDNLEPIRVRYYGTDLGWSYVHDGTLHFLFGDTSLSDAPQGDRLLDADGVPNDDMFATLDLSEWPDPRVITPLNIPPIRLGQVPGTNRLTSINTGFVMDGLKTPEAGFSNGQREFGIFILSKPRGCSNDQQCAPEFRCDTGMGIIGVPIRQEEGLTLGCIDGRPGCVNDPLVDVSGKSVAGSGLCVDLTSSVRDDSAGGRFASVAMVQRIGLRDEKRRGHYTGIADWLTNKFINTAARTVEDFDPARGSGYRKQDYRNLQQPAIPAGRQRSVLLWGRPGFIGVGAKGRPMNLYFAYLPVPTTTDLNWQPQFFTGLDASGKPQFSPGESEAAPVDLDATEPGAQPDEEIDAIQHMSVVWIEELKKWIMFYGGGIDATPRPEMGLIECGIMQVFIQSDCLLVDVRKGSIYMRSADDPWGPWSAPQVVISGGDPKAGNADQYAPGGMLYHSNCKAENCAPHSSASVFNPKGYGWFYGSNLIEPWIVPAGDGVDVIWNASTWDPYRVILLRTRISR